MSDPSVHESRSQALADEIRRFLITANTGGIAAIVAFSAALVGQDVQPNWAIAPLIIFLLGIVLAAVSMFLAQYREIKRRDASERNESLAPFGVAVWSWVWNCLSLGAFVVASAVSLCSIAHITV